MTATTWICLDPTCAQAGSGDRGAEKHCRDTTHAVTTHVRRWTTK